MYITEAMIAELARRYGRPVRQQFRFPVDRVEFERIRGSQKEGREHDFTLYIVKDRHIVVIAKHFYPPGLYRAPSGGVRPGEDPITGIYREAQEETGCECELERLLLHSDVRFEHDGDTILWHSYVFQAAYVGGDFAFTDRREIREVRLASLDEFARFGNIMRKSRIGGLHYRAALHEVVEQLLVLPE